MVIPVIVTPDNMEEMQQLVKNGRDVYPGANFLIMSDGHPNIFPYSSICNEKHICPINKRGHLQNVEGQVSLLVCDDLISKFCVLNNF